jgi:hypothetical protein
MLFSYDCQLNNGTILLNQGHELVLVHALGDLTHKQFGHLLSCFLLLWSQSVLCARMRTQKAKKVKIGSWGKILRIFEKKREPEVKTRERKTSQR